MPARHLTTELTTFRRHETIILLLTYSFSIVIDAEEVGEKKDDEEPGEGRTASDASKTETGAQFPLHNKSSEDDTFSTSYLAKLTDYQPTVDNQLTVDEHRLLITSC